MIRAEKVSWSKRTNSSISEPTTSGRRVSRSFVPISKLTTWGLKRKQFRESGATWLQLGRQSRVNEQLRHLRDQTGHQPVNRNAKEGNPEAFE